MHKSKEPSEESPLPGTVGRENYTMKVYSSARVNLFLLIALARLAKEAINALDDPASAASDGFVELGSGFATGSLPHLVVIALLGSHIILPIF
jgi:hypothetical protein